MLSVSRRVSFISTASATGRPARHGRACPGHPRQAAGFTLRSSHKGLDVDARNKSGHDGGRELAGEAHMVNRTHPRPNTSLVCAVTRTKVVRFGASFNCVAPM